MLSERIARLRRQAGWSQEELAERLDVSRQSVFDWESGAGQPGLDQVLALSELFGVSTDFLLKGDVAERVSADARATVAAPAVDAHGLRLLSEAEINRYLENRRQCAPLIALGVALCVACPAPLLALQGFARSLLSGKSAAALGVTALFVMLAAAVAVFVSTGMRMSQYNYIEREYYALSDASRAAVAEQRMDYSREYKQSVGRGVALFVLSVVPVTVAGILGPYLLVMLGTAALLVIVAAGVFLIVRGGMIMRSFSRPLKRMERSIRRAMRRKAQ